MRNISPNESAKKKSNLTTDSCILPCQKCWTEDYKSEVHVSSTEYSQALAKDRTRLLDSKFLNFINYKIDVPLKTGSTIIVAVWFKVEPFNQVTEQDVIDAKRKMEEGVNEIWNGRFSLLIHHPKCGIKTFKVIYKPVWVKENEDYILYVHYLPRRAGGYLTGEFRTDIGTSRQTYAHEFGHAVGLPDEYTETEKAFVRFRKPDKKWDVPVPTLTTFEWLLKGEVPHMANEYSKLLKPRHCWNIALEVQELLRKRLGCEEIKCTVKMQ